MTSDASVSTLWQTLFHFPNKETFECETPLLLSYILPDAKYIVMLRNPVKRLYSEYWYLCGNGDESRVEQLKRNGSRMFHEVVERSLNLFNNNCKSYYLPLQCLHMWQEGREKGRCNSVRLHASLYYLQLVKWFSVISRKQFFFIKSEELFHNPYEILRQLIEFLELPPISDQSKSDILLKFTENSNKNVQKEYYDQHMAMLDETKVLLDNFFRPFNHKLVNLLQDKRFLWDDV